MPRSLLPCLVACFLALVALPARAACDGTDLRATLDAEEQTLLEARTRARAYPEGNHWRATKGAEVLHLIGTMHLEDARFEAIEDRLSPVIESAALLLLEMTAREEATLETALAGDPNLLLLPDTTLPELMVERDWQRLATEMRERGLPPFMASKFRPWYVAVLLAIPACMDLATAQEGGLDSRLESVADGAGVPTRALEPFDTAFRAFEATPLEMQIDMLRASLVGPGIAEDLFATLLATYFEERHAESWSISEVLAPRLSPLGPEENAAIYAQMEDALLVRRNRAWMPVIREALDETDGVVVAAFGAAHLNGEDGILDLLDADGFALERLPF